MRFQIPTVYSEFYAERSRTFPCKLNEGNCRVILFDVNLDDSLNSYSFSAKNCSPIEFDYTNPIKFDGTLVNQSQSACNLGVMFDETMTFNDHTNKVCKSTHL